MKRQEVWPKYDLKVTHKSRDRSQITPLNNNRHPEWEYLMRWIIKWIATSVLAEFSFEHGHLGNFETIDVLANIIIKGPS